MSVRRLAKEQPASWDFAPDTLDKANWWISKYPAERKQSAKQAEANRALFGRTKSERAADAKRAERASDLLDQHRIDGGDAS